MMIEYKIILPGGVNHTWWEGELTKLASGWHKVHAVGKWQGGQLEAEDIYYVGLDPYRRLNVQLRALMQEALERYGQEGIYFSDGNTAAIMRRDDYGTERASDRVAS